MSQRSCPREPPPISVLILLYFNYEIGLFNVEGSRPSEPSNAWRSSVMLSVVFITSITVKQCPAMTLVVQAPKGHSSSGSAGHRITLLWSQALAVLASTGSAAAQGKIQVTGNTSARKIKQWKSFPAMVWCPHQQRFK